MVHIYCKNILAYDHSLKLFILKINTNKDVKKSEFPREAATKL